MNVVHRVTGYDKATERLSFEFDVLEKDVSEMRGIAGVDASDVEAAGSYSLDEKAAYLVAARFHFTMPVERCDWFFEPIAG